MVKLNTISTETTQSLNTLVDSFFLRRPIGGDFNSERKYRRGFHRTQDHGITVGMQIGGTNTRIMVGDPSPLGGQIDIRKDYSPNVYKLDNQFAKTDIETLQEILKTISENAVGTSRVVVSMAGFPTQTGLKVGEIQPKNDEEGLMYLSNVDFTGITNDYDDAPKHAGAKDRMPYINMLKVVQEAIDPKKTKLTYIDEANPSGIHFLPQALGANQNEIIVEIQNDTVSAGESAAAQHAKEHENSKGIVLGTGFNDSSNRDFNEKTASSRITKNNESGQSLIIQDLLLTFDKKKGQGNGSEEAKLRAETFFSGASDKKGAELMGVRRMLQNIKEAEAEIAVGQQEASWITSVADRINGELEANGLQDYRVEDADVLRTLQSIPAQADENTFDIPSNEAIELRAKTGDKFMKALLALKFNQLARYLIARDKTDKDGAEYLKNLSVIGVTGSVIAGNFTRMPELKEAFLAPFKAESEKDITLHIHEIGGLDGMDGIINAKAALAKLAGTTTAEPVQAKPADETKPKPVIL